MRIGIMAARQEKDASAAAPATVPSELIDESEPLNDKFLMEIASKLKPKFTQFGVILGVTQMKINKIEYECNRDAPLVNFIIMTFWRDNIKGNKPIKDMYDTLCSALRATGHGDLSELVRNDEERQLNQKHAQCKAANDRLKQEQAQHKASKELAVDQIKSESDETVTTTHVVDQVKATAQPGQGARPKDSISSAVSSVPNQHEPESDETVATTLVVDQVKAAAQTGQGARPKDSISSGVSSVPKQQKSESEETFATTLVVDQVKATAQPAEGESSADSKRRTLNVISLIRQHQQSKLWSTVSDRILKDGSLDVNSTQISSQELQDLTWLFVSGAASNIVDLNVNRCHLTGEQFADLLTAIGNLKQLKGIRLHDNDLRGRPLTALTATIGHVRGLGTLDLGWCHLSDGDVTKLLPVISTLTTLKMLGLGFNSISDDLAGRVAETVVNISSLTQLSLNNNCLTQAGITKVRHVMRESPSVWLVGLDWQRPAGQEVDHPDPVVTVQRWVDDIQRALGYLQARPLADRDERWGKDKARLQSWLRNNQDRLSRPKAERDGQH